MTRVRTTDLILCVVLVMLASTAVALTAVAIYAWTH
jgi:hypothetical protein